MSTRGKTIMGTLSAVVVVAGVALGYLMFTGQGEAIPFLGGARGPATCPLTGEEATNEALAERTAVAVKVENISEARPQAGLQEADIVYEEPVEGGITRFIALYQCTNADRIGPIRSARFVDASVLLQYGPVAFGYSGGIPQVLTRVAESDIQDVGYDVEPEAYVFDETRVAPHHVYSSTRALLQAAETRSSPPEPVFEYGEEAPERQGSRRAREVHLAFSPEADVYWRYQRNQDRYVRFHGETPHTTEDGEQVSARNIVVMQVRLEDSGIVDAAGNPSPEVIAVGTGPAWVVRDGRVVEGEWRRPSASDVTEIVDADGDVIPLAPGRTWIELFPSDLQVEIG